MRQVKNNHFNKTYAIFNIMKKEIKETLDSKGKYRCVRFDTGEVGMVDEEGNVIDEQKF